MRRCRTCKCDLHAGRAWEEEHDGKTFRYIHLVCMNRKCQNYRQVMDTEVIELKPEEETNEPVE